MSWAARRRFTILSIIGAIVVVFLTIVLITIFNKAPTCTDNVQNQGEAGIDCGGPCPYLCTALEQPAVVLFTKVLQNVGGRTDVVALVENKNANAAAKDIPYRVTLYGVDHTFIQEAVGTLDLPPGATMPVFTPGIFSGNQKVESAFLEVATSAPAWFFMTANSRVVPTVSNVIESDTASGPHIEATLANPSATALTNVQAIVLVYDSKKNIIAASKTILPVISGQGQSVATFTWNTTFSDTPALIEVVPIIPLSAQTGLP